MTKKTKKKTINRSNTLLNLNKLESMFVKLYQKNMNLTDLELKIKKDKYEFSNDVIDWQVLNNIKNLIKYKLKKNKKFSKLKLKHLTDVLQEYKPKSKTKDGCFKDYKLGAEIGSGAYGTAFLIEKNGVKFIAKTINLEKFIVYPYNDVNMILREIENQKKMSDIDVAPKYYDSYICKENGNLTVFIIMEYMSEGTLNSYLAKGNKLTPELKKKLDDKIDLMHKNQILHTDLHNENVLLTKKKNGELDIYIADWGLSINMSNKLEEHKQENRSLPYGQNTGRGKDFDLLKLTFSEIISKYMIL